MEFEKIGEATWGLPKEGRMRVPVRVYAKESMLSKMGEDRTLQQARNVATLPGIVDAALVMPDGHEGYGFPIGGVAAFGMEDGIVSPGGVGYDINCGVRLLTTNLTDNEVRPKLRELINGLYANIPCGVGEKGKMRLSASQLDEATTFGAKWAVEQGLGVPKDLEHIEEEGGFIKEADPSKASETAHKRGGPQFGTLGSGNHFLEIQRVDKILDAATARAFGITAVGQVTVMIHSGSRGYGHQVCDDYIRVMLQAAQKYGIELADHELCCAPLSSKEAQDYFGAMNSAVNYAFCNRQVMTHWVRETFQQVLGKQWENYGMDLVYDVCHNIAKMEEHEVNGKKTNLCVHRKGATRAFPKGRKEIPSVYRSIGQPVIIPGTMQTASYLLVGLESGKQAWYTTCHGAGRVMSRHEALRNYRGTELWKQMEATGMAVKAPTPQSLAEEAGGAYKNVDDVVESVELAGLSKIVARMTPLGVIKG
ncbi:RtcB family protein [Candidatus Micrarchaeota archaeon]|nr:RtcB family protein [Candidatus Micrarchaeota archaeon]